VQEALSNVRKHAQASQVWLTVRLQPPLTIELQDDGCGFDTGHAARANETHVGLRIMRERGAGIGADLSIHSQPGGGTRVQITLPERQAAVA
jgi:two-component system, NarL family, nitrate/nitrite sensor histidine kinase NarX